MAATATVQQIVDYYVNLLIIQYHNKPKAMAMIAAFVGELLANGIALDVQAGYNLNLFVDDPLTDAVGKQLDVLGKYAGVDRYYRELTLINYFGLTFYTDVDPDSQQKFGFSDYADFSDDDFNGTLTYGDIISTNNQLLDAQFRVIIELAIINNNSNFSHASIDNLIFKLFGTTIRPESNEGMQMFYFVAASADPIIKAVLYKKLLPHPMSVGLLIVTGITGDMFGFTDYSGGISPYANGFTDYADYDNVPGQVLTYDQITQG